MNTARQVELVKSWGFTHHAGGTSYTRQSPQGYTEWWYPPRPDYIEFADKDGNFSHDWRIDWTCFK